MSKILITGGCGMLGSSLAQKAIILGHDVCIVDNLCKSGSLNNLNWLKTLGHNIENPVPSLFTFNVPNNSITELMGTSIDQAKIKIIESIVDVK